MFRAANDAVNRDAAANAHAPIVGGVGRGWFTSTKPATFDVNQLNIANIHLVLAPEKTGFCFLLARPH
jgi:hypothetical protein